MRFLATTEEASLSEDPQAAEIERLQRHISSMATTLLIAHRQFLYYEENHRKAGTPEGNAKADTNMKMARMCADALVAPRPC